MGPAGSVFLLFLVLGELQVGWEGEKERFFWLKKLWCRIR